MPRLIASCVIALAGLLPAAEPVRIAITGDLIEVNGQREVPAGLFGVHAVGVTADLVADLGIGCDRQIEYVPGGGSKFIGKDGTLKEAYRDVPVLIDCQGDRFCTPSLLQNPKYEASFAAHGTAYGKTSKTLRESVGRGLISEFWNEPYLNWAERSAGDSRNPYDAKYYEVEKAVEGGPVTIKGWDRPLKHFRWRSLWPVFYVETKDKQGNPALGKDGKPILRREIAWSVKLPEGAKEGDRFRGREERYWRPKEEREYVVEKEWHPVDPTMVSFWSGRQNLEFYGLMFKPFATALREADPDTPIVAGWCFNYSAARWKVWTELYRPLLEEFPTLIDGTCDHHYDVDPLLVQAWYEVGTADAMAITGRFLRHYNTECQGRPDPSVHGHLADPDQAKAGGEGLKKLLEANYNLCDLIGLVARLPDKAASRTAHNFSGDGYPQSGSAFALRLLKTLRGRLLAVETSDPRLFAAASLAADGATATLAVFNAGDEERRLDCGFFPARTVTGRWLEIDPTTQALVIRERAAEVLVEDGAEWSWTIPRRSAVIFQIAIGKPFDAATAPQRVRRQFFAREKAIQPVEPGRPLALTIAIPEDAKVTAPRAVWLRVSVDQPGEGGTKTLTINGTAVPLRLDLPVTDLAVPAGVLKTGDNRLEFTATDPWLLGAASLIVER